MTSDWRLMARKPIPRLRGEKLTGNSSAMAVEGLWALFAAVRGSLAEELIRQRRETSRARRKRLGSLDPPGSVSVQSIRPRH